MIGIHFHILRVCVTRYGTVTGAIVPEQLIDR